MSHPLVMIPMVLWLIWRDQFIPAAPRDAPSIIGLITTGLLMATVVLWTRIWARRVLGRSRGAWGFFRRARSFGMVMLVARLSIVTLFGVSLFHLGWGELVLRWMLPMEASGFRLPGLVVATLPAFVALAGLWWGVYPIERESRELSAHDLLEHGLPVFMPPGVASYVWANVRMQMLVTLAPALAAIFMIDLVTAAARGMGLAVSDMLSGAIFVLSLVLLFPLVPWLMKTLLDSSSLAPSELRSRLDDLAARIGVRYGDVLVWRTGYGVGNALVIGLLPRLRYVLLSDLLIETLSTRQVEAVFAHEAGHLRHRHLLWFVIFFVTAVLTLSGPSDLAARGLAAWLPMSIETAQWVMLAVSIVVFVYLFGVVSRHFERQADAYAARAIQALHENRTGDPGQQPIGAEGIDAVAGALRQVARVNHMPTDDTPRRGPLPRRVLARLAAALDHYRHPSIARRIAHLEHLTEPGRLERFDRRCDVVIFVLLAALVVSGGLTLAISLPT